MVSEGESAPLTPVRRGRRTRRATRRLRPSVKLVDVADMTPITGEQNIVVAWPGPTMSNVMGGTKVTYRARRPGPLSRVGGGAAWSVCPK